MTSYMFWNFAVALFRRSHFNAQNKKFNPMRNIGSHVTASSVVCHELRLKMNNITFQREVDLTAADFVGSIVTIILSSVAALWQVNTFSVATSPLGSTADLRWRFSWRRWRNGNKIFVMHWKWRNRLTHALDRWWILKKGFRPIWVTDKIIVSVRSA